MRSLHIYAKWRYSKDWKSSEKYGTNDKEHEILIRISRFCIVSIIAAVFDVLSSIGFLCAGPNREWIAYAITNILIETSTLAHTSAIDFSYEFGHFAYSKVYGKMHKWCYEKTEAFHTTTTHNNYQELKETSN